ncbi:MAG: acetolactate synthase small subunit [Bacilli bacterium]
MRNRIISTTVMNQPGVLNRITGLMSRRGFNIESITVGHSETEGTSRMTFVISVDDFTNPEQIVKQLNKQIDILKVEDITDQAIVARELALIRIATTPQTRAEISSLCDPFRASIVDVSKESMIIEVTGEMDKIDALVDLLSPYGVLEIARTGTTGLPRGSQKAKDATLLM